MNKYSSAIDELRDKYNIHPNSESIKMMLDAGLKGDDIVFFSVQEHYGRLLIEEISKDRRSGIYNEGYEVFSKLQFSRGNFSQGITQSIIDMTLLYIENADILEIGPGSGAYVRKIADRIKTYSFIEPSKTSFGILKNDPKIAKIVKYDFNGTAHEANFPEDSFDVVFSNDVYEHLHPSDADAMSKMAYNSLRKNGNLILISSNRNFGPFDGTAIYAGKGSRARGLHINETSYRKLTRKLKDIGFVNIVSPFMPISIYNKIVKINRRICERLFLHDAERKVVIEERLKCFASLFSTKSVVVIARK